MEILGQLTFCETCMRVRKQQLEPDIEQTGSKSGKEYIKNFSSKCWENIWKDCNWKMKTFLTWKRKLWTKSRVQSLIQDKPKRNTPRHIVIKIRMKNKDKVLKAAREKQWITYKRIPRTWPAAVSLTNKKRRKSIWQIPTPIYNRNSPERGHRGNRPQHTRGHIWQSQPLTYSNGEELKTFSPRSETKMPTLATVFWAAPPGMWDFTHWPGRAPYTGNSLNHWTIREVLLPLVFNIVLEAWGETTRGKKKNQLWKKEDWVTVCRWSISINKLSEREIKGTI